MNEPILRSIRGGAHAPVRHDSAVGHLTGRALYIDDLPVVPGTLYNVHQAVQGAPVTRKFVSVCGAVKRPISCWVPVGTSFRDLLALGGGATVPDFGMFVGGIMMGTLSYDLDDVVTKTTAGTAKSAAKTTAASAKSAAKSTKTAAKRSTGSPVKTAAKKTAPAKAAGKTAATKATNSAKKTAPAKKATASKSSAKKA